jgi:hypothetical protein
MEKIVRILIIIGVLLSLAALVIGQAAKTSSPRASDVASINTYVKQVDRFIKINEKRKRIFGEVGDEEDSWREFKGDAPKSETPEDLDQFAYVWTRSGKVVAAGFTFQSGSRDWAHFVTYYFRADGTLAKIHSRLNTFYGGVTAIRDKYYGHDGRVLMATARYLDIQSGKPKKNPNFQDERLPIYLSVRKLPFFKLL